MMTLSIPVLSTCHVHLLATECFRKLLYIFYYIDFLYILLHLYLQQGTKIKNYFYYKILNYKIQIMSSKQKCIFPLNKADQIDEAELRNALAAIAQEVQR